MIWRLAELALLGTVAMRFLIGQWPWERWPWLAGGLLDGIGGNPADRQREKQARVLLGVEKTAARADILDAHRRLIARVHPDRGGTSDAVHEANAARDLLLERLGPKNLG
ncbi:molecular chaperone DnaJ [Novosphingobium sp.]|uniref:molecular chaperone DnaJ n=1 Tax=Novosphingobium sp. TaxID=1874826 RepID=UPI00333F73B9